MAYSAIIHNLADLSPDVISIAHLDERVSIVYVSPSVTEILGYSPDELVGVGAYEIVIAVRERSEWTGDDGLKRRRSTVLTRCKDGSTKWMTWIARLFPEQGFLLSVGRETTIECLPGCHDLYRDGDRIRCRSCRVWDYASDGRVLSFPAPALAADPLP